MYNHRSFTSFSESRGITHKKVYPHQPIGKAMKMVFSNKQSPKQHLSDMLTSYRSTPHPETGVAPGNVIFRNGYRHTFPRNTLSQREVDMAHKRDIDRKKNHMDKVNQSIKRKKSTHKIGERVWVRNFNRKSKYDPFYERAPATIYQLDGRKGLLLKRCTDGSEIRRHRDDVKPYQNSFPYNFPETIETREYGASPNQFLAEQDAESQATA